MDNRITKTRLKTFITYDLIKVVAILLVVCVALLVVFNMVADKPSTAQTFYVLCDTEVIVGDEGDLLTVETAERGTSKGGFSYDILKLSTKVLETGAYNATYMLETTSEVGDDDIFIAQEPLGRIYLNRYYAVDIVEHTKNAKKYCIEQGFYTESGEINQDKIIESFLKTRKNDNRFRSSENKEKGKKLEVERIKAIWENANLLLGVYENHPEIFASQFNSFTWGEREIVGNFAIDLSKLTGSSNEISNAFKLAVTNEETYEVTYTVEGLYLFIGNNYDINGDLDYESLAYLRTIIEKYTNFVGA